MQTASETTAPQSAPAYEDLCLYIDGEFIQGGGRPTGEVLNPATGQVIAQLPHATRADLDRALAAAARAFESWKKSSPIERKMFKALTARVDDNDLLTAMFESEIRS